MAYPDLQQLTTHLSALPFAGFCLLSHKMGHCRAFLVEVWLTALL